MSQLKVQSAFLQASGANPIFGAETTLNRTKQPGMFMTTDGTFLICKKAAVTVLIPLTNVKMLTLEEADESKF